MTKDLETCWNCDGDGLVHSHNPLCWICGGTGKTTQEENKKAKDMHERMSKGYVHRGSYD